MAVLLMHISVPLRGRKGKTSGTHRQLHSLFDSHEKNVTRGSSHQREAARESKRPSRSHSTECSTENLVATLVTSHTQNRGGKPCLRILTNLFPNPSISPTSCRYRLETSCSCEHTAKGFKSIPVRILRTPNRTRSYLKVTGTKGISLPSISRDQLDPTGKP